MKQVPYIRESHAIVRFYGEALQPAEILKRTPDARYIVEDTIARAEALLDRVRWRRRHQPWLYDLNQLLTLHWMIQGERELLHEITQTKH